MFLELIGTVFAGIAAAGVMMLVNKLTGGRLPRWTAPVVAGLAMIVMTIASEYGWYGRTTATLPDGVVVIETVENRSFYRPWTMVSPYVDRFAALDEASLRRNPDVPGQTMADLYFFGRWAPVNKVPILVDCDSLRRASLADGATYDGRGAVSDADWVSVTADDAVLVSVCEGA